MSTEYPPIPGKIAASSEVRLLRENAPTYLDTIGRNGAMDIIPGSVTALHSGPGEKSACYFLRTPRGPRVVKFVLGGIAAEAEALNIWRDKGVRVPQVVDQGKIDHPQRPGKSAEFIVLEGISDKSGSPAQIADNIDPTSEFIEGIGRAMGRELAKMHAAVSRKPFGDLDPGTTGPRTATWNDYLVQIFKEQGGYLLSQGVNKSHISKVIDTINSTPFPTAGSYVHGDFGRHNILVPDQDPQLLYVFDPTPKIADPYWDLSHIYGRYLRFQKLKDENPTNVKYLEDYVREELLYRALFSSYMDASGIRELDTNRLKLNFVVRQTQRLQDEQEKLLHIPPSDKREQIERDLKIRKLIVKDHIRDIAEAA